MKDAVWKIKSFHELTNAELYKILQIRQEVFNVEQNCDYLDADGFDDKAVHLWAQKESCVVAYCRIFEAGIKYKEASIGRVLTHQKYRRVGVGKILMKTALQCIKTRFGTEKIRISAQDYLIQFYSEFGFNDTGKKYLEDHIPHTEMLRNH